MTLKKLKQSIKEEFMLFLSLKKREIKNSEFRDKNLTNIKIPYNVKVIGSTSFYNNSIKKLELPPRLTQIKDHAFSYNRLTSIDLPNSIKYIEKGAFSHNTLKRVNLPNKLKVINAFTFETNQIKSIEIPSNVETIEGYAFYNNELKNLDLSSNTKLKTIGKSSFKYNQLNKLILPDNLEVIGDEAFGDNQLISVSIPDSVTNIGENAFECNELTEIKLPNNITKIKRQVFQKNNLKSVLIPDKVTIIDSYAFYRNKLTKVKLSKNLETIETFAFSENELFELEIPNNVEKIGNEAFSDNELITVKFSDNVKYIGEGAFRQNRLLHVVIPRNIQKINRATFKYNRLQTVILPDNLKIISSKAFENNNIRELKIPKSIERIESYAFNDNLLQKLVLSNNLNFLGENAFSNNKLSSIVIPSSIKKIPNSAFRNNHLQTLVIPEGIESIGIGAFKDNRLKKVTIPDSVKSMATNAFDPEVILKNNLVLQDIISIINQINRVKITDIEDFYRKNQKIKVFGSNLLKYKLCSSEEDYKNVLTKIKKIYYKTRLEYLPSFEVLEYMEDELIDNFDLKVWQHIKDNNLFDNSDEMNESLLDIIEVFGLFKNDKNKYNRLKKFLEIVSNNNDYILTKEQYNRLCDEYKKHFNESIRKELRLKEVLIIPDDVSFHLKERISPTRYKYIKSLKGAEGAKINNFLKQIYEEQDTKYYIPNYTYINNYMLDKIIKESDILGKVTKESLHRMFPGNDFEFNEEIYNFLIKYFDIILEDEKLQSLTPTIIEKFYKIKKEYNISDNELPTLKQCYSYCLENEFEYKFGNKELAEMASIAGVSSDEAYQYYEELNELVKRRKNSVLIRSNDIYNYNGITLKGRLLRSNDSFAMFVGETNYTNCCQSYDCMGESCMEHASTSLDGGIFEVSYLKDDEWIQLCQSWDWQNEGVYCHDNIEATEELKENPKLKDAVAYVYKKHADKIINESSKKIDKYVTEKILNIEKPPKLSLKEKEKVISLLEELKVRQKVKVVTVGEGYSDIKLSKYFPDEIKDIRQPKKYKDYSDAKKVQYIISGKERELIPESSSYEQLPIYRDERCIFKENGEDIKQSTLKLMHDIEKKVYPKEMISYSSEEEPLINNPNLLADIKDECVDNLRVIYGEDWYFLYSVDYDKIILCDLAKDKSRFTDEQSIQMTEINNALKEVLTESIKEDKPLLASFREDTTYLIYLMYLKSGLLEQIGDDTEYQYNNKYQQKIISKEEQLLKLKDIKKIRRNEESKTTIHKVTFKPSKKYIDNYYNNKNKILDRKKINY